MLIRGESINCVEFYKLELANSQTRMTRVCTLGLPPLAPKAVILDHIFAKEWISSLEYRARSQLSQRRHLPFCSSRNDTMALLLGYCTLGESHLSHYAVLFSITALLTVVQSGVREVSWGKMGPSQDTYLPLPPRRQASTSWPFLDYEHLTIDSTGLRSPASGACSISQRRPIITAKWTASVRSDKGCQ